MDKWNCLDWVQKGPYVAAHKLQIIFCVALHVEHVHTFDVSFDVPLYEKMKGNITLLGLTTKCIKKPP